MSANRNVQTGEQIDEVFLVPYQVTNFLVQEQQHAEMAARIAAQRATATSRGTDRFLDNSLARAWYRKHPDDLENNPRSSDEVGGRHLVCFVATVLRRYRVRMIHPRLRKGVAHE